MGGTGAIWSSLTKKVAKGKIKQSCEIVRIDPVKKVAIDQNGTEYFYENILSTIPLKNLVNLVDNIPSTIIDRTLKLKHSSTNIVGIGVEGQLPKELEKKCWMYFPEENCPFYRVTLFSNYSKNNVPDHKKHISFMTETSESEDKNVNHADLIDETIQGLIKTNIISKEDKVVSTWMYRAEFGYPTPSLERDEILKEVIPYLDNIKVYSRGRFGAWKYEVSNQDHSFMQGVEWVDKIFLGKKETTLVI